MALEVLLITYVLVNGEENVKSRYLRFTQQLSVLQAFPAHFTCGFGFVAEQLASERPGDAMIEENRLSGVLRGTKLLYYQLLMATD